MYHNNISSFSVHTVLYHDRILSMLNAYLFIIRGYYQLLNTQLLIMTGYYQLLNTPMFIITIYLHFLYTQCFIMTGYFQCWTPVYHKRILLVTKHTDVYHDRIFPVTKLIVIQTRVCESVKSLMSSHSVHPIPRLCPRMTETLHKFVLLEKWHNCC